MQKAQRMKHPLVAAVLRHLALNRPQRHQHIAMRVNDAARLRGRPRGEDDLKCRLPVDRLADIEQRLGGKVRSNTRQR